MEGKSPSNRRNSRIISSHKALPRRPAQNPITALDDPLRPSTQSTKKELSVSKERKADRHVEQASTDQLRTKDYSFLTHPDIYHDIPRPFFQANRPPEQDQITLDALTSSTDFYNIAIYSAKELTSSSALDLPAQSIFALVYARLTSLIALGHGTFAGEESKAIGDIHSAFYQDENSGKCLLPWNLRLLVTRIQASACADYPRRGIGACYELARQARTEVRDARATSSTEDETLWRNRLSHLGFYIADLLIEQGDLSGAIRHLASMTASSITDLSSGPLQAKPQDDPAQTSHLILAYAKQALALIRLGDLDAAARILTQCSKPSPQSLQFNLIRALHLGLSGDLSAAQTQYQTIIDTSLPSSTTNQTKHIQNIARNNKAVSHLYTTEIQLSIPQLYTLLQAATERSDTTSVAQSLTRAHLTKNTLFNLATCYELTGDTGARESKNRLLEFTRQQCTDMTARSATETNRQTAATETHGSQSLDLASVLALDDFKLNPARGTV